MRAVGGILEAASAEPHEDGAGVTRLIRGANMPHGRISGVLRTLVSQGLLEQVDSGGACRYRISQSGRDFLRAYRTFSSFADDFGLSV